MVTSIRLVQGKIPSMKQRVMKLFSIVVIPGLFLFAFTVTAQDEQDFGTVIVATNAEFAPFEDVSEDDGSLIGFDIEIMEAIAEDAGFEIEWVNTHWDGIFLNLSQGAYDVVIGAALITEEREELVAFSDPYFNAGQFIVARTDIADSINGPEDLVGMRVGVETDTPGEDFAVTIEGIEIVRFANIIFAFEAMDVGEIEAALGDAVITSEIITAIPELEISLIGEPLTEEFFGIAVNPRRSDVLEAINVSLVNIIESGEYAEIYEVWFQQTPPSMFLPTEETQ